MNAFVVLNMELCLVTSLSMSSSSYILIYSQVRLQVAHLSFRGYNINGEIQGHVLATFLQNLQSSKGQRMALGSSPS